MVDYQRVCEEAARAGGRVLSEMKGKILAKEKGPADLVTAADLESQMAIFSVIRKNFPSHRLLGEETVEHPETESLLEEDSRNPENCSFTWIVDPLDGTTNYVHGLENFSVSVALHDGTRVVAGTVLDPVRDHCYSAAFGSGAFLNGIPIQTSQVDSLADSLVAASFSPKVARDSPEIERFLRILTSCQAIRRLGSAALNLCYVACGKLDAYWATSLKQWDVAAGQLIVREAGGVIAGLEGDFDLFHPKLVACSQQSLADEMLSIFSD